MILFFTYLTLSDPNLTIHDIGVAVWSGKECINTRMVAACNTWVKQFPEVAVYSDFYPKGSKEKLQSIASPTKLLFFELGDCRQHYLVTAWQRAQPRFMKAMEHFYRYNTSKKWYFFCDDDSFPIARNLVALLKDYNSEESKFIGKLYCAWPEVVFGKKEMEECILFAQGGAGVCITATYFARIVDNMTECNAKFTHRYYAGSMRFAKCSHDAFPREWIEGRILSRRDDKFFSTGPISEIEDGANINTHPVNFHKLSISSIYYVRNSYMSMFNLPSNNASRFTDWRDVAGNKYTIYMDTKLHSYNLMLGYYLGLTDNFESFLQRQTSQYIPVFDEKEVDKIVAYKQYYNDNFLLEIICDDTVPQGKMWTDHYEIRNYTHVYTRMKCPPIEEYVWP